MGTDTPGVGTGIVGRDTAGVGIGRVGRDAVVVLGTGTEDRVSAGVVTGAMMLVADGGGSGGGGGVLSWKDLTKEHRVSTSADFCAVTSFSCSHLSCWP